jgi:crotonobetainyl-CoA:carnitine CoA-transferase CaiB-like acyl-CoA transferase
MSDAPEPYDPPLAGMKVVDLISGPMESVTRLLIDLGADVTRVNLVGISDNTDVGPVADGIALGSAIARLGSRAVTCDRNSPEWKALLQGADLLLEDTHPDSPAELLLNVAGIRQEFPTLVILSISDFGRGNTFSHWQATTPVLHALTSELSRSGIPDRSPLIPPGELPYEVAASQAVFVLLSAYIDAQRTGLGDRLDFSILDGAMQALDPPFGMTGSAAAGVPLSKAPRGRAEERYKYPILPCADGFIRICVLAARQWRGMFAWMGSPDEFADASYDNIHFRFNSPTLLPAIARFFADKTRADLEKQGQEFGVPTAGLLTLDEALVTDQIIDRAFFHDVELAPGIVAPIPNGVIEIDGARAGIIAAPSTETRSEPTSGLPILAARPRSPLGRPLEGIRVLDLGVIVVGGDTGRLFGDLGADVIKIENSAFLDGARASLNDGVITPGFAAGHRNKRSIGINVRESEGKALVDELVRQSDIVLTNFKPGVIHNLGLDYESLKHVNPGIVVVDSSAFGPTGPWSKRLGYGPLVRAASGFTAQWVYPGEPDTFSDAATVYPDHVCARIGAFAALAMLIRRERTHTGGSVSVAQSEVMLGHMGAKIAAEQLEKHGHHVDGLDEPDAPWGLYPAAGDDNWVAITVRSDADWRRLCTVLGRTDLAQDSRLSTPAQRKASLPVIDEAVSEWTAGRSAQEAMDTLQREGVPAGMMLRAIELPEWGYYQQRRDFREEWHTDMDEPSFYENTQVGSHRIPDPPVIQAPHLGEQTYEIADELLGVSRAQVDALIARGVLEVATGVVAEPQRAQSATTRA